MQRAEGNTNKPHLQRAVEAAKQVTNDIESPEFVALGSVTCEDLSEALAIENAASVIRYVVDLFLQQNVDARRELARLAKQAPVRPLTDEHKEALVFDSVQMMVAWTYEASAHDRQRERQLRGFGPSPDPSRAQEDDLEATADDLCTELSRHIPEMGNVPRDAVVDLLRRSDPKDPRKIGAPYFAGALCVLAGALGYERRKNETVEQAARRQSSNFRHVRSR